MEALRRLICRVFGHTPPRMFASRIGGLDELARYRSDLLTADFYCQRRNHRWTLDE